MKNYVKASLVFCLLVVSLPTSAIGADDTSSLSDQRYVGPKGYFTIVPPAGWEVQEFPQDDRGKVAFLLQGSDVELRVLVATVDFDSLDELLLGATDMEKRLGKPTNIEKTTLYGRPAIKRTLEMNGTKLQVYDFLIGNTHHNLQYGAPPSTFAEFVSIAEKSMETYEPKSVQGTTEDALEHTLAGKRRIAQIAIEAGNLDLAAVYVEEGLQADPTDFELIQLRGDIEKLDKSSARNVSPVTMPRDSMTAEDNQPKEPDPADLYIAAIVGALVALGAMITGIEFIRLKKDGFIFNHVLAIGVPTFGLILIGDGIKAGHFVPVAVSVVIFIAGFALWYFRLRSWTDSFLKHV